QGSLRRQGRARSGGGRDPKGDGRVSRRDGLASGDRLGSEVVRVTHAEHAADVPDCGKASDDKVTVDAVHDPSGRTSRSETGGPATTKSVANTRRAARDGDRGK